MKRFLLICLFLGVVAANLPAEYWKNLAHGINARSLHAPGMLQPWFTTGGMTNCTLPMFRVPFSGMANYGPAGINPFDGTIYLGLKCIKQGVQLPFLWVVTPEASHFVEVSAKPCSNVSPQGDMFEGFLNFLPDGGIIFGACNMVFVLPPKSTTLRNLGTLSLAASIITVVNSEPAQLFMSGWGQWKWVAAAFNIEGMTSHNLVLKNAVYNDDTTIMFSTDGKTMYNGHFTGQSPGGNYGLQYWKTPFTANSQPFKVVSWCGASRPWTYSTDSKGNYYSSWCSNYFLVKIDAAGNMEWNISCPRDNQNCYSTYRQQMFMTDDERYIYVGSTNLDYYVVDAHAGKIIKSVNFTALLESPTPCAQTYGPFTARWPLPLVNKTRAVLQCIQSEDLTTIYSVDPFAKKMGIKQYTGIPAFAPIMYTDSSDNIYALGIASGRPIAIRFPA